MSSKLKPPPEPESEPGLVKFSMGVPVRNALAVKSHATIVSYLLVQALDISTWVGLRARGIARSIIDRLVPAFRRDRGFEPQFSNWRRSISDVAERVVWVFSSILWW